MASASLLVVTGLLLYYLLLFELSFISGGLMGPDRVRMNKSQATNSKKKDPCGTILNATSGNDETLKFRGDKEEEKINVTSAPSTDGPLVPLLIEGSTTLLYEATLPGDNQSEYTYFSPTYIGKQIECQYTIPPPLDANGKPVPDPNYQDKNCQLYVRHIKPTPPALKGFRQVMYASILKPITLVPIKCDIFVSHAPNSNRVFIALLGAFRQTEDAAGPWDFDPYHVGWTFWIPGRTSVLIQGFPLKDGEELKYQIVMGYATEWVRQKKAYVVDSFRSYLMDMSTPAYREKMSTKLPGGVDRVEQEFLDLNYDFFEEFGPVFEEFSLRPPKEADPPDVEEEDIISTISSTDSSGPTTPRPLPLNPLSLQPPLNKFSSWKIEDGGCHHVLELVENPVLKGNGGQITLDFLDAISFSVRMRPITAIGKLSMYRPLLNLTNSNPAVLSVKRDERLDIDEGVQILDLMMKPTGHTLGTSSVSIRSILNSTQCLTPLSLTYIVQVRRDFGRRLWINFPIPFCKSHHLGQTRMWKVDKPFCTPPQLLLDAGASTELDKNDLRLPDSIAVYHRLPKNYRPPSERGEKIPLSIYTYNADPAEKSYNNYYHITNDTKKLRKCSFRKKREDCCCSDSDRLSDDPDLTDCKEMVYTVPRGKQFEISVEYDPLMRDEDQNPTFFTSPDDLPVYFEEINGRKEFSLESEETPLLEAINSDKESNNGRTFYNGDSINITFRGTGLFHFKVGLGKFDSAEGVTGYFTVYSDSNELNHVKLVVIMLLTITFCFSLVFLGFLRVRKRLSSQLPFQTRAKTRFKVE